MTVTRAASFLLLGTALLSAYSQQYDLDVRGGAPPLTTKAFGDAGAFAFDYGHRSVLVGDLARAILWFEWKRFRFCYF